MKSLYKVAQKYLHRLKRSEEDLSSFLIESPHQNTTSKKTPTQFLDYERNFLAPGIRGFRLAMTETMAETKNLLQDALVVQTQIDNFVMALETADQNMSQINKNLAIAQKNDKERQKLISEAQALFSSVLPAIQKAKKLSDFSLASRLLETLSRNISGLDNAEKAIQKAQIGIQTLSEISSFPA